MSEKIKLLLIDKDKEFLEEMKHEFEIKDYEVITAMSSAQGLDKVRVEQPDFIIVELMLETHDGGFDFTKKVKADPIFRNAKIIMTSSAKEKTGMEFSQEKDGYWMKTDDFINKPVTSEELIKRVQNFM